MIIILTFALLPHLIVWFSFYLLWRVRNRRGSDLIIGSLIALLVFSFIIFASPWAYTSFYFTYFYGILALGLTLFIIFKKKPNRKPDERISFSYRKHLKLVLIVALAILNFLVLKGRVYQGDDELELSSPLRGQTYYVLQGGNSPITNVFHRRKSSQDYALDIVALNSWGNRANTIYSPDFEDFEVYGDTVYSPISGTIARAEDGMDDTPVGVMDFTRPIGNYYFIQHDKNRFVILGHLQKGSIWLKKGRYVEEGTPLGLVGNTGRTIEPHLHLQAVHMTTSEKGWDEWNPIPFTINGKFYGVNETWKVK